MYFEIENQAREAIKEAIANFDCEIESEIRLDFPPNPKLGDLASTVSFDLAKKLRKAPNLLSVEIADLINVPDMFEKVEAVGPYVNFFIDYTKFSKALLDKIGLAYGELPSTYFIKFFI